MDFEHFEPLSEIVLYPRCKKCNCVYHKVNKFGYNNKRFVIHLICNNCKLNYYYVKLPNEEQTIFIKE